MDRSSPRDFGNYARQRNHYTTFDVHVAGRSFRYSAISGSDSASRRYSVGPEEGMRILRHSEGDTNPLYLRYQLNRILVNPPEQMDTLDQILVSVIELDILKVT
jgi:hypothetical protein